MSDLGIRLGVEGEKEFKNALKDINQAFKVLGSEMTLVASQFDKNDKSVQSLTSRNATLEKSIDAQKNKIETLRAALENASESFGENDKRTQNWQIQLNKAQAELNGMERELSENNKALREHADNTDDAADTMEDAAESADDLADSADDMGDELKEAGDSAEKSGGKFEKLGGILKGIGAAMGAVATAAGAAAVKLGKEVVQQFGELEQNLGGSEAVFGQYAASIQKTGEDAYKNLGVSQSQYLAIANKMGALFQGSGIEQVKSLELTEKAMQRAADMASVMGIDMQVALDSVAGAAKGNFTMMDNLGIAMNATNIEAYALAKGLDFTWKTATQAEKAEVAMQMFFEKTEQYAGNFARESTETITGSLGLMKAATSSFIAGLGNANADMTNLTGNMVDAFQAVVKNIVPVIENIVAALPAAMDAISAALRELLPVLLDTCVSLFRQVLEMLLTLLPDLIPVVVDAVMTIIQALIDNLPLLMNAAVQLITALVEGIGKALPQLIPAAVEAVMTIVKGLLDNLPMILNAAMELILGLTKGLMDALPRLIEALPKIITAIIDFITSNLPKIIEMGIKLVVELAAGLIKAIPQLVAALPQIVTAIITGVGKAAVSILDIGKNIVKGLWDGIASMITWITDKIKNFVGGIVSGIKGLLGIKSPSTVFSGIGENMGEGVGVGFDRAMGKVAEDMKRAIPTDFDVNPNVSLSGVAPGHSMATGLAGGGPLVVVQQMIVRSEDDIRKISQELYNLMQTGSRAQGRLSPA